VTESLAGCVSDWYSFLVWQLVTPEPTKHSPESRARSHDLFRDGQHPYGVVEPRVTAVRIHDVLHSQLRDPTETLHVE
jgi:hypothetical protein